MADGHEDALQRRLQGGLPAMLEIGSALKSAEAWEVEAGLIYDDLAWFLYDEHRVVVVVEGGDPIRIRPCWVPMRIRSASKPTMSSWIGWVPEIAAATIAG